MVRVMVMLQLFILILKNTCFNVIIKFSTILGFSTILVQKSTLSSSIGVTNIYSNCRIKTGRFNLLSYSVKLMRRILQMNFPGGTFPGGTFPHTILDSYVVC